MESLAPSEATNSSASAASAPWPLRPSPPPISHRRRASPSPKAYSRQIVRTTLPNGRPSTRYRRASDAAASGKVLATIGLIPPDCSSPTMVFHASSQTLDGGRHGVANESRVVLYSLESRMWATRFWSMLDSLGFDRASVLDGGFEKWSAEGRLIGRGSPRGYPPGTFTATPRPGSFVDRDTVLAARNDPRVVVINALGAQSHKGLEPSRYGRLGRIPGSVNVSAASLYDDLESGVPQRPFCRRNVRDFMAPPIPRFYSDRFHGFRENPNIRQCQQEWCKIPCCQFLGKIWKQSNDFVHKPRRRRKAIAKRKEPRHLYLAPASC